MTDTKFTPGPWCIDGFNTSSVLKCVKPKGHQDAKHLSGDYSNIARCEGSNWKADARLIAAAPDLYRALSKCTVVLSGEEMSKLSLVSALEDACAALAKARGEA